MEHGAARMRWGVAGLIGAVALGKLSWPDISAKVAIDRTYEPDPTTWGAYDRAYKMFRGIHRRARGLYRN